MKQVYNYFLTKVFMSHTAIALKFKISVPDNRGVSGQNPDKVTYMTRQTD